MCHQSPYKSYRQNKRLQCLQNLYSDIKPCWDIPFAQWYGICTYIWVIYGVNVGKYSIHGASGYAGAGETNMPPHVPHHCEDLPCARPRLFMNTSRLELLHDLRLFSWSTGTQSRTLSARYPARNTLRLSW